MAVRAHARQLVAVAALALLAGCASSSSVVVRGGGAGIEQALAEPAEGKYRIAVATVIDKSGTGKRSIDRQLVMMNAGREEFAQMAPSAVTEGVRDMLVTELFGSERFIVLDRAALDQVIVEQEFQQSARAGDETRVPLGELEGAELLVLAAITSFDAGVKRSKVAIPFTFGDDDIGVLNLGFARGQVVMDMRVVDVRTGRVLASVAVRGRNQNFDVGVDAYIRNGSFRANLPKALTAFAHTPVEKALQEMVIAAVGEVVKRTAQPSLPTPPPPQG